MTLYSDKERFRADIHRMLKEGSSNDIVIKLSDGIVSANKDVLAIRCDYFKNMLRNNFKESESNLIDLSYISRTVFEPVLEYIFSGNGNYQDLPLLTLLEITKVCDMMLLTKLGEQVSEFLVFEKIPGSGSVVAYLQILIQGLKKVSEVPTLSMIEDALAAEVYFNLWSILQLPSDASHGSNEFQSLPFRLGKDLKLVKV